MTCEGVIGVQHSEGVGEKCFPSDNEKREPFRLVIAQMATRHDVAKLGRIIFVKLHCHQNLRFASPP